MSALVQKVLDFTGYVCHRTAMLLRFQARRLQHRWIFRGQLNRILVVRLGSIGDVVRASAVVARLKGAYPEAAIDFLTSSAALPVICGHSALRTVYTLDDFPARAEYDWVINLQTRDPPDSFLDTTHRTYHDVLQQLKRRVRARLVSGRRAVSGGEVLSSRILYCRSEMEELFLIALQSFDPEQYPETTIQPLSGSQTDALHQLHLPEGRSAVGVFLGSNSVGCGADDGFRTYSIDYLEQLVAHLSSRFTVVIIGQSKMRSADEMNRYRLFVEHHPQVVDLVDKTSLDELVALIGRLSLLVSSDSSPVHIALATGVPVIGLYVCDASFRMSPRLEQPTFVAINSRPPCFYYSWRWRFFCSTCYDDETRATYCQAPPRAFGVDRIPLAEIDHAAQILLRRVQTDNPQR